MKKIFVTRKFPLQGIALLERENFSLTFWPKDRPMTPEELVENTQGHHGLLCTLTETIDANFLDSCPQLDMISQFAVGFDNIDIDAATRLGIPVGYTPGAMSDATADTAFGLMIAVSRKMFFNHRLIHNNAWGYFNPVGHLGCELKNKTLGILGLGRIGSIMAQRCKGAYDMNIIYHNRRPATDLENKLDAVYVSFDDLLEKSDILSAHCALTDETRHLFNREAFKKMKPSAIFINTARGPVHQESDLINALQENEIWGAGLDVTDPEPMDKDNPLLFMENVCVLPHIGSATLEARNRMSVMAATNIIEFYKTRKMPNIVNPEVL